MNSLTVKDAMRHEAPELATIAAAFPKALGASTPSIGVLLDPTGNPVSRFSLCGVGVAGHARLALWDTRIVSSCKWESLPALRIAQAGATPARHTCDGCLTVERHGRLLKRVASPGLEACTGLPVCSVFGDRPQRFSSSKWAVNVESVGGNPTHRFNLSVLTIAQDGKTAKRYGCRVL
jgi:hypothetical protein